MPKPVTPLLAADTIIELTDRPGRPIVLIERLNPPHGWAIPGGFVDVGERLEAAAVREALDHLAAAYEARGGGFYLAVAAGGHQLRSRPQYHPWIRRLQGAAAPRLSRAALETLAIVAYRQPVMRAEIESIRGVDCGGVLRLLMERKLLRVMGRKEIPGRPLIYGTTRQFLEAFELRDLKDLPTLKEIQDMGGERPATEPGDADGPETDAPASGEVPGEGAANGPRKDAQPGVDAAPETAAQPPPDRPNLS